MILSGILNLNKLVDDKLDSIYNSNATIQLKDRTLQISNPFRHAIETIKDNLCKSKYLQKMIFINHSMQKLVDI